ncbi:MAG: hypothetical protein PVJ21_14625 [Anaerolineales bacterium]|jgi:hypothetical protein
MIRKQSDITLIMLSVRVYQALLVAYPKKFKQEYGSHMLQVFRDCCLRTFHQGGTNGMARLWAVTLFDLVQCLVSEHAHKEIEMKKEMKPEDIRLAGSALMIGGVVFVVSIITGILGDINPSLWGVSAILLTFFCMPLLLVGMLAVRNRYGGKVGWFGRNILLFGAILGPVISLASLIGSAVADLWILIYVGPAVLLVCLALFGVVALFKNPLPRWNFLPVIAGLWFPTVLLVPILLPLITGNPSPDLSLGDLVDYALLTLQGAALVGLGYILKSDVPEEMMPA